MNKKIEQLKKILTAKKADALFLTFQDPSHFWILGKKLENSYIIIKAEGKPILIKGKLEYFKSNDYETIELEKKAHLGDTLSSFDFKRLCVDFHFFTLDKTAYFKKSRIIDISRELYYLRSIKDDYEIRNITDACSHTTKCFSLLITDWKKRKYKSENDAVKFIRKYALDNSLELSFNPIVASGRNACIPHHDSNGKISRGFCVIDLGLDFNGYKSDMTRTVFIGKPTKEERKTYDKLLSIQERALIECIPGKKCSEIYMGVVKKLGLDAKYFTHGLGHGLGVEIHELPNLKEESMDMLAEKNVVTIEPGIYNEKKGIGIRIEDTVLVMKKPKILTTASTKKLISL